MKTIGFIDYFLHEWHADNYPAWIQEATKGEMQVGYAWAQIDGGGMSNEQWCREKGITLCASQEEVIEKSDYLVVLSPDNPEMHVELTRKALESGKPTYIDKTFAPNRADALRIFEVAEKHGTPCFSSSALRFSDELRALPKEGITGLVSIGGGPLEMYCIHQLEPIIVLMGTEARRVMCVAREGLLSFVIEFSGGRTAIFSHMKTGADFTMHVNYEEDRSEHFVVRSPFFQNFIAEMCDFFTTKKIKVPHEQTIAVISVREAVLKAAASPFAWIDV